MKELSVIFVIVTLLGTVGAVVSDNVCLVTMSLASDLLI